MGPRDRYVNPEVPAINLPWQDPIPPREHALIDEADISNLEQLILDSGLSVSSLVSIAWASVSTYRDSDERGINKSDRKEDATDKSSDNEVEGNAFRVNEDSDNDKGDGAEKSDTA